MGKSIASVFKDRVRETLANTTMAKNDAVRDEIELQVADIYRGVLEFATKTHDFVKDLANNPAKDKGEVDEFLNYMVDCIAGYVAYLRENMPEHADATTRKDIMAEIARGKQYYNDDN